MKFVVLLRNFQIINRGFKMILKLLILTVIIRLVKENSVIFFIIEVCIIIWIILNFKNWHTNWSILWIMMKMEAMEIIKFKKKNSCPILALCPMIGQQLEKNLSWGESTSQNGLSCGNLFIIISGISRAKENTNGSLIWEENMITWLNTL